MNLNPRESVCGKCGYIVKGLATLTCPECGSDLRDVGIVSPDRSTRWSGIIRYLRSSLLILGWTALCAALYMIFLVPYRTILFGPFRNFGGLIDKELWPYRGSCRRTVSLFPASQAFGKIILTENMTARCNGNGDSYRIGIFDGYNTQNLTRWTIEADLQNTRGLNSHLMIDVLQGMMCHKVDADGKPVGRDGPLDRQLILDWMRDADIDMTQAPVQREAVELLETIKRSADSDYWPARWSAGVNAPVGRLERIVLNLEQHAKPGTTPVWSDRSGAEQQTFGPPFDISWIGIPLSLLLWTCGTRFLVRRGRDACGTVGAAAVPPGSRTTSIMFTDMIGYTARTSLESRDGLLKLICRKRGLIQEVVTRRHGRIVKTMGDGLLIAFDSATDAVLAGLKIQEVVARQNRNAADDRERFELRIAISTGEVAVADNDVYGEAVNLASRVQHFAHAGEVYFTEPTFATLNKTEAPSAYVGSFEVKGVVGMVTIYRAIPKKPSVKN